MEKYYMVFDMTSQSKGYNKVGIAPRMEMDYIGKGVIDEAQLMFENIQYVLAGVIVFCVLLISAMIYCFCKMNIKEDDSLKLVRVS